MLSNENYFQWDLLCPTLVHYFRGCWCIQGAFKDKFLKFLGLVFFRKLARTKTQQGTDKASEHKGRTVFLWAFVFLTCASIGVMSTLYYHLSSIHYTSSLFAPTYLFVSAYATGRVHHHWQSMPPPTTEYSAPLVWAGMRKHITAFPPVRWTRLIWWWWRTLPLPTSPQTTKPLGTHPSSSSKATSTTATAPSAETLIHIKGWFIHLHGLYNLWWYSTFTSSSDATSNSDAKTVTSCSSTPKQRRLVCELIRIPDGGQWSDPALALGASVFQPPFSAASICPLSA